MMTWSAFHPNLSDLSRLLSVPSQYVFGAEPGAPLHGVLFFRDARGEQLAISWAYGDVQFKFEVYFLDVRDDLKSDLNALERIAEIPPYENAECFFRTSWIRPANPGEVPENYEQIIEECGPITEVPVSAIAVGTSLFGIGFSDANRSLLLGFAIDDSESYSVRAITDEFELASAFRGCDRILGSEVELWLKDAIKRGGGN